MNEVDRAYYQGAFEVIDDIESEIEDLRAKWIRGREIAIKTPENAPPCLCEHPENGKCPFHQPDKQHAENLAAMVMKIGELENAIRNHLFVCPLPCGHLRRSIGYEPGIELAHPAVLPPDSLSDLTRVNGTVNWVYEPPPHSLDCGCIIVANGSRAVCEMHADMESLGKSGHKPSP